MSRYGDVQFVADGKQYTVRYSNLAWDECRRTMGGLDRGAALAAAFGSDASMANFLRAGLMSYHPELSLADVRRLYDEMDQPGVKSLSVAAQEAIEIALPDVALLAQMARAAGPKDEAAPETPPTPEPTTHKRSSKKR